MSEIFNFFNTLRWQDIVDIVFNSYIIFRLYVLFRGSSIIKIVPVVALLWPIKFLAISMGLVVTNWAIQGVMATVAIILIIVFRDEIAAAFQFKNPLFFFWGIPSPKTATPIEIIAQTMFELAKLRIGALLVLPGNQSVEQHIQGGVEWGGTISEQMLISIFWDKNPVHDGAVLIKKNRVSHVSVILPLSKRSDFPSKYGTRHRAAAGMSEVSDAMIIAVSEERGAVTVAKEGVLQDVKTVERLRAFLADHTGQTEKKGRINWRGMTEFGLAAILCFVMVTWTWFGLSRGKEMLTTFTVPIEYTDVKAGFDIIKTSANTVELQLSGSMPLLKSLNSEGVKVLLKLGNTTVGENTFTITEKNIALPPGVNLKKAAPEQITLVMGGVAHRRVPVQIEWSGKLPETILVERADPEPAYLNITGVSPGLEEVVTLYTEKIPLSVIQGPETGALTTKIVLTPKTIKLAEGETDTITVKYVAKERTASEPLDQ